MTDPQAETTYMWTQELDRNIQENGDRQTYRARKEGETEHTGRGNQVQGIAKQGQRKR